MIPLLAKLVIPRPNSVVTTNFLDIIVHFRGAANDSSSLTDDETFPDKLLTTYSKKADRKLMRFGQRTTHIWSSGSGVVAEHAAKIKTAIVQAALSGFEIGKVFIYGSSSGGRNAINLGITLNDDIAAVPIEFLAAIDAAWFPNETRTIPNMIFFGEPTNTPMFTARAPIAAQTFDVFQRVGNHSKQTSFHGLMFTSDMPKNEIHGNLAGLLPVDVTTQVRGTVRTDDDAHVKACQLGRTFVQDKIRQILDAL